MGKKRKETVQEIAYVKKAPQKGRSTVRYVPKPVVPTPTPPSTPRVSPLRTPRSYRPSETPSKRQKIADDHLPTIQEGPEDLINFSAYRRTTVCFSITPPTYDLLNIMSDHQ